MTDTASAEQVAELTATHGIAQSYIDVSGRRVQIPEENRREVLELMGYPLHDRKALEIRLRKERQAPFDALLEPVTVLRDGEYPCVLIYLKDSFDEERATVSWQVQLENGECRSGEAGLYEAELVRFGLLDGHAEIRRLALPADLPWGYHRLKVSVSAGKTRRESINQRLIRTPLKAYVPEILEKGRKVWGVSTQLYALRSERNWGCGDFADLSELLRQVAACGGSFVGLNPLHAAYLSHPDPDAVSPYSPSSRRFLNVIYISVPAVPGFENCDKLQQWLRLPETTARLKKAREAAYVDYREVMSLKLTALRFLYEQFKRDARPGKAGKGGKGSTGSTGGKAYAAFTAFVKEEGAALQDLATYDALQAALNAADGKCWGWPAFPEGMHAAREDKVAQWREAHQDEVEFYCYLQYLARTQLQDAHRVGVQAGLAVGIYRDLAVGVNRGSCDVWSGVMHTEAFNVDGYGVNVWTSGQVLYALEASLGAPPDPLGPLGQTWGLSPQNPRVLKEAAYEPLIALYRANMRDCGALRIDHAAGLNRLWWVREGKSADHGAYVDSCMHDLLGIIALESVRNRCLIIAEDLGTIPQELRTALKELGAFSYKLFFGERAADGGYIAPRDYPAQAMAALTTHDMPTLYGWWNGLDLELGGRLGLYTPAQVVRLKQERAECRQRILDSLHGLNSVGAEVSRDGQQAELDEALALGMQIHMCRGACALYSAQLEDWVGERDPVNVPGTFREYPNWRRKLSRTLEDIFADPRVQKLTAAMTRARSESPARG